MTKRMFSYVFYCHFIFLAWCDGDACVGGGWGGGGGGR